ncbi:DUF927 domain-containing protein [Rhodobacter capsulatus]|uniref:DUF927 domain-containing protein n=1 Tax=Rhodobacter capsulatus TaxID=1061 RepID=UPI0040253F52
MQNNVTTFRTKSAKPNYLPEGFSIKAKTLFYELPRPKNAPEDYETDEFDCCDAFTIVGRTHDHATQALGTLIEHGGHRYVILDSDIHATGNALQKRLSNIGIRVTHGHQYLHRMFTSLKGLPFFLTTDKSGWYEKSFVQQNGTIIGDDQIYLVNADLTRNQQNGTLETWQENVAALAADHPKLLFALATAFSGPLLEKLGDEFLGVHYYGQSSIGKSTALQVATSLFGRYDKDQKSTWRATDNGLENTCRKANSSLLALDEIGEVDAKKVKSIIYMISQGKGKDRMTASGGTPQAKTWRLSLLSTGEISINDLLSKAGENATGGLHVRLLNIDADTGINGIFSTTDKTGSELSNMLKQACNEHCGVAGPEYIKRLLVEIDKDPEAFERKAKSFRKAFRSKYSDPGAQEGRALDTISLIAFAGELANEFGITKYKPGLFEDAAHGAFKSWCGNLSNNSSFEERALLDAFAKFFASYATSKFEAFGTTETRPVNERFGYRDDRGNYYLLPAKLKELIGNMQFKKAKEILAAHGFILSATAHKQRCGADNPLVYEINAAIVLDHV